ncbi:MAG TPA: gliding motility-associated C-terminal domain-containing protein, partial [Adhaeribacter sp.]|nr:gliding motility-associated C-terminal domain-containing protein [Adhaeribacter sp.]
VTGSSQCNSNTASVTVTVLPKPTAVNVIGSASVCPQVQNVWYKAHNPQQQQLTWGISGGSIAASANDSISVNWGNANSSAMVWAVPKNRLGCPGDTVFFPVTINVILATETPKGADTLCLASAKDIAYRIGATTNSVYTWGIQGGSITAGQGTAAINVTWNQAGTGKLWVHEESQTSTSLCRGLSDTLFVLVHPSPTDTLIISGPAQVFTLTENQEYRLLNGGNSSTFTWIVTGGEIASGQGTGSIKINWAEEGTGSISVTETNQFGCPGKEATLAVKVSGKPQPVFYNIITPNNDGLNDAFFISNLKWYPQNELQIFNRWGSLVYQKSNYQNNWKGENLSSGVYYYHFRSAGQRWKGWVEVVK